MRVTFSKCNLAEFSSNKNAMLIKISSNLFEFELFITTWKHLSSS